MSYDPFIGVQLGSYKVIEAVGEGGMARIYRGIHTELERYVAIKVVNWGLQEDPEFTERFRREAQSIALLRHPNIVQIFDFGKHENGYYMVMEFIEAGDLANHLHQRDSLLPKEELLPLIRDIGAALDYAHAQNVIHRDVKPSNIMLMADGQPVLTDFGLVMLPSQKSQATLGNTFGTPHYVAPEQAISSAAAVPASDVYSLGVMLFEMLTGELPFNDESPLSVALKHVSEPPPQPRSINPDIPVDVEKVILKSLAKDPHDRYGSALELANALETAYGDPQARPRKKSRAARLPTHARTAPRPPVSATIPAPTGTMATSERNRSVIATYQPPANSSAEPSPDTSKRQAIGWIVGVSSLIGAIVTMAMLWSLGLVSNQPPTPNSSTPIVAVSDAGSEFVPPPADTATPTLTPIPTLKPTATAIPPTATFTASPTATAIPPTATATPTETATTAATATETPSPTVVPPTPTVAALSLEEGLRGKILFLTDRDGPVAIYQMDANGSNQKPVPLEARSMYTDLAGHLNYSADGTEFVTPMGDGQLDLWLVNVANGSNLRITSTAGNQYDAAWSPTDRRVVYVSEEHSPGDLYLINLGGSALRPLTSNPDYTDRHPTWSPDGQKIAFWSNRGVLGNEQIWMLNVETGEVISLSDNTYNDRNPVWVR